MKAFAVAAVAAVAVDAFPAVMQGLGALPETLHKRDFAQPGCTTSKLCDKYIAVSDAQAHIPAKDGPAQKALKATDNCGALHQGLCKTFDAGAQYVSTSGQHAWKAPGASDIRGPCPGLNAAANHGYLPRNGIATIAQTIQGLGELYGMSVDLAGFLAVYSIAFDGDIVSMQWSIGGPLPNTLTVPGLINQPQGDGYSHNNYEGDTSIARCDAYINGGDAHSLSVTRFKTAYESGMGNPYGSDRKMLFNFDSMGRLHAKNTHRSIQTNPLYFAPLFSTTLVAPAAYNFIVAMMSNHSAEYPAGRLDGYNFKTFFGIGGQYPNFRWLKGQERVPDNWYRRTIGQDYDAIDVFGDLIPKFAAYPDSFRFGGNVNGVNSYAGIDISNVTGGVYNAKTLFEGNNFSCFFVQNLQQGIPLALQDGVNDVGAAVELLGKYLGPIADKLSCPQVSKYDPSVLNSYKGYPYKPTANPAGPVNC